MAPGEAIDSIRFPAGRRAPTNMCKQKSRSRDQSDAAGFKRATVVSESDGFENSTFDRHEPVKRREMVVQFGLPLGFINQS